MIWFVGIGVCLLLSAFFSASEMAFLSTDRIRLRDDAERGVARAQKLLGLYEDSREFLTAVLIGNNLVNITAAVLLTAFLHLQFGIDNEWLVTALLAPVLIVFSETVPKGYGRSRARGFLMDHSAGIIFWSKLFAWPARALLFIAGFFPGGGKKSGPKNIFVNEDEFRFLIEESVRSGVLEEHEQKLVERILDFERIPIEKVSMPVTALPQIELTQKVGEAKQKVKASGSKVVLVYEEIPSLIIGMIYVFDLLFETDEQKALRTYLRSPIFLPKETSLEKAFWAMQEKRQSFALVTDARREVIGMINIESLLAI